MYHIPVVNFIFVLIPLKTLLLLDLMDKTNSKEKKRQHCFMSLVFLKILEIKLLFLIHVWISVSCTLTHFINDSLNPCFKYMKHKQTFVGVKCLWDLHEYHSSFDFIWIAVINNILYLSPVETYKSIFYHINFINKFRKNLF